MNKDQFSGKWKELKGKVKENWGKLSDDDIFEIDGKWDQLSGKLQQKYGWTKEQAEQEMNDWCSYCEEESKEEQSRYGKEQNQWKRNEGQNPEDLSLGAEGEEKYPTEDENKDKKRKAG